MKKLFLAGLLGGCAATYLLASGAGAQTTNTTCWPELGGAMSCTSSAPPVDPYVAPIIQLEMLQAFQTGSQAFAPTPGRVTIAVATVWIKCNHVQSFTVQYSNGGVYRSTAAPDTAPVDRKALAKLVATGKVVVVDEDDLFGAACTP
jgi:hypothetical protein